MFYTDPLPKFNKILLSLIETFHERKNTASQLPLLYTVWVFTGGVCLGEYGISYSCNK